MEVRKCGMIVTLLIAANSLFAGTVTVTPQQSLQGAVDKLQPGDTLELADGTYYQDFKLRSSGTPDKPITIKAKTPGRAILSGTMEKTPVFEKATNAIYRTAWSRPRFKSPGTDQIFAMADGRSIYNCELWSELTDFKGKGQRDPHDGPCGAPRDGFFVNVAEGNLYLRVLGDVDPNTRKVLISRPTAGVLLEVVGQQHIVVEGLRFEVAPVAGVLLSTTRGIKGVTRENEAPSRNITIRDCAFLGCLVGVKAVSIFDGKDASPAKGTSDITIEYCQFSKFPTFEWERCGTLDFRPMHSPMYNSTLGSQAIYPAGTATRWKILHCYIHDQFDGIGSAQTVDKNPALLNEFAYNLIHRCADDAIEFDAVEYSGIHVHHNFFLDNMTTLAFSPLLGGGVTVDRNIVYHSPEYAAPWGVIFKFQTPNGFRGKAGQRLELGGMTITNNTFIHSKCGVQWGTGVPADGGKYFRPDALLADNILYANDYHYFDLYPPIRQGFTVDKKNLCCGPTLRPGRDLPEGFLATSDTEPFVRRDTWRWDVLPPVLPELAREAKLGPEKEITRVNFAVSEEYVQGIVSKLGLPAAEFKGQAAKLGAVPPGTEWKFPRPGPRWAVGDLALYHPPFPPSLDPWWVGFAEQRSPERTVKIRPWLCDFAHKRGNLARWATITASDVAPLEDNPSFRLQRDGYAPGNVVDDFDHTVWRFKGDAEGKAWLEMDLGSEMTFNFAYIQEVVGIARMDVNVKRGTEWVTIHSFDMKAKPPTPPYHNKFNYYAYFAPTTARYVRFAITLKPSAKPSPKAKSQEPVLPQLNEIRLLNEEVAQ